MASIWAEALAHSLDQALEILAAAVADCTDHLWQSPMWRVPPPGDDHVFLGPDGNRITGLVERSALAQRWVERRSTPWSVSWHALEVLDYDLDGGFGPWAPPPPFTGHPHWRNITTLPAPWPRSAILGYIDHARGRVWHTLAGMTDAIAARPLPPSHRYHGQPHAWIIASLVGHTTEHAAQIRQFITAVGIRPGAANGE